ncbi:MAG: DinB family protein [Bacillota bacterium]|nr:DinB family protein [Bacillota bacterium]
MPDTVPVCAEVNDRGEAIVFAFDWPGACGWGPSLEVALAKLERDIEFTRSWLLSHGIEREYKPPVQLDVVETVVATGVPLECDSEGFFTRDAQPYTDAEVELTGTLLAFSRDDLLRLMGGLRNPQAALSFRLIEGKRTILEILDHVAIAEWWYTTRIGAPSPDHDWRDYGDTPFERLRAIRQMFVRDFLPGLRNAPLKDREQTFCLMGETWSARKVLRRAVWHELLHYKQLLRLVPKVEKALGGKA